MLVQFILTDGRIKIQQERRYTYSTCETLWLYTIIPMKDNTFKLDLFNMCCTGYTFSTEGLMHCHACKTVFRGSNSTCDLCEIRKKISKYVKK